MDLSGISPPVMDWDNSNLPERWEKFLRHVELIFKGPLKSKEEEEKIAYLLIWVGDKGRDVCQSWSLDAEEAKLLKTYYDKFQAHVQPKLNPVFARFRFNNEVQGSDSIDKFVTRLRLRARDCRYGGIEDELIRDRIVFGTNSANVREKLINEGEKLTLDKAIHIAQNFEYCRQQMASMNLVESADRSAVDAVRSRKQITNKALKPKLVNNNKLRESMIHLKNTQKQGYDKTSKPLKPLNLHDSVGVQFGKFWRPGKVMQIHPNRSYTIQTRDGAMYRRNRRAIIKTNENTFDIKPADFNILAQPSNSFPNEPQIVERTQKAPDPLPQNPYITRSGRVVKNNQRYNSAEWTK